MMALYIMAGRSGTSLWERCRVHLSEFYSGRTQSGVRSTIISMAGRHVILQCLSSGEKLTCKFLLSSTAL